MTMKRRKSIISGRMRIVSGFAGGRRMFLLRFVFIMACFLGIAGTVLFSAHALANAPEHAPFHAGTIEPVTKPASEASSWFPLVTDKDPCPQPPAHCRGHHAGNAHMTAVPASGRIKVLTPPARNVQAKPVPALSASMNAAASACIAAEKRPSSPDLHRLCRLLR